MAKIPFLKSMVVKFSDFHSNVLQCRLIFIRLSGKVAHALLVKMKYIKNRYGLLVCQCSKLHISALYKLTESVQSLSKFLLVKSWVSRGPAASASHFIEVCREAQRSGSLQTELGLCDGNILRHSFTIMILDMLISKSLRLFFTMIYTCIKLFLTILNHKFHSTIDVFSHFQH